MRKFNLSKEIDDSDERVKGTGRAKRGGVIKGKEDASGVIAESCNQTKDKNEELPIEINNQELNSELKILKYLNEVDEIVGLSELDENKTQEFIIKNRIPNVWYIIDSKDNFNSSNKLASRYEILIKNLKIVEYRSDPTFLQNLFIGFSSINMIFAYLIVIGSTFMIIYENKKDNDKFHKILKYSIK